MSKPSFTASIWARRNAHAKAMARATKKRDRSTVELSKEEQELLRRSDALAREIRIAEEKTK